MQELRLRRLPGSMTEWFSPEPIELKAGPVLVIGEGDDGVEWWRAEMTTAALVASHHKVDVQFVPA